MKKGVLILFLGLLMYNTIGFIISFQFVLAEWRQEMRAFLSGNINENDLVRFTFQKAEFNISTHEFSKEGKRYDVVKTKIVGDNIIVYCFQDDKETQLATEFNDLLFQNTTSKGDLHKRMSSVFQHLRMEYVFENPFCLQHCPPSVLSGRKSVFCYQNPYFPSSNLDIITPPPQFVG